MGLPWEINMNAHNHHLFVKPMLVLKTLQMTTKPCRKSPFREDLIVTGSPLGRSRGLDSSVIYSLRSFSHLLSSSFLPSPKSRKVFSSVDSPVPPERKGFSLWFHIRESLQPEESI